MEKLTHIDIFLLTQQEKVVQSYMIDIPSSGGEIFMESKYTKKPETIQMSQKKKSSSMLTKFWGVKYELDVASEVGPGDETWVQVEGGHEVGQLETHLYFYSLCKMHTKVPQS